MRLAAVLESPAAGKKRCDLVGVILVFLSDMAKDDDHPRFFSAPCEMITKISIEKKRVQAHGIPRVKERLAGEAARLNAERELVPAAIERALSSYSAPTKTAVKLIMTQERTEKRKWFKNGEKNADGKTSIRRCKPERSTSAARTIETLSDADCPSGFAAYLA